LKNYLNWFLINRILVCFFDFENTYPSMFALLFYFTEHQGRVVPVKVKLGSTGKMQSLNLLWMRKNSRKESEYLLKTSHNAGK